MNIADLIIALSVGVLVVFVLYFMIKNRKKGNSCCGTSGNTSCCGCSGCTSCSSCYSTTGDASKKREQ